MNIEFTEAGAAIFIKKLTRIESDNYGTKGSIGLFILLDESRKPACYALLWEWGGDWMCFGDGEEFNEDALDGWEPSAIYEAIAEARKLENEEIDNDLEWFNEWAENAEKTLENKD